MYLALKEIKKEKLRFFMIILTTALLAYLVYFLSALAFGLAQLNRTALDHMDFERIVLNKEANGNVFASFLPYDEQGILLENKVVNRNKEMDNLVLIQAHENSPVFPKLELGRWPESENEFMISRSALESWELELGSELRIGDQIYQIVGFSQDSNYNTLPVAYTYFFQEPDYISARFSSQAVSQSETSFNLEEFLKVLPGYRAQVLTFGLMIISLSLIATLILGVFMYILTMQKQAVFGVLKIQGYSNYDIIGSLILQNLILLGLGLFLALLFNGISFYFLASRVPIKINAKLYAGLSFFLLISSLFGSLFSARSVLKIDPLDSI